MDLRQLEYIVAIADHGSFTAAARAVHVSQPSLSHGVLALERSLGVELFTRSGRTSSPTAAGRDVVDAARLVLRGVADLAATAASVATLRQGTVEIVALPTLAVDPLAALLGRFRTEHPGILVRVREPEDPTDLERMVRSGEVELGLSDITTGGPGLVRVELFRQEVVVVAPPNSTLPEGPISARSMAALPLVVTPAGTSTRRLLDRALARDGHTPVIAVEIGSREAIVPLVLAGAGAALLPRSLADDAAARGAQVRSMHPKLTRRVGLLHRDSRLSPAAAALLAMAVAMPPQF